MTADLYLTHSVSLKAHPPEDKLAIQNKTVETASVGFLSGILQRLNRNALKVLECYDCKRTTPSKSYNE